MPRVFHKRSGSWVEIKSIFQRRSGSWVEILNVFRRVSGTWVKVFSASKIPGNTVAPTITGTGYLFSTLTNNSLGTWTNSPTSYTRQWRRGNPAADGGEPSSYSNISGATSSTYTTTSTDNGKYIICQVTATNALGSNSAASNPIYVKKYAPVALGTYSVSGGLLVGSTLTATVQIGTWKNTTNNTDDTYPDTFIYEWSDTNGNILQETSSNTYLILSGDLNKTLRLRVKGINTGGEEYTSYQSLGTVTAAYRFAFGNNLYVSSNGHIGLDSGSTGYTSMSSGRNISVFVKDFQQYYLAEYSDSSVYYLYIKSYLYNTSASSVNALDYQIKFYNDTSINYCDVYIVRKGSSVGAISDIATGYYSSGTTGYAGMVGPYSISQGTVFRVYFGDQAGTTSGIPWTSVNNNLWDVIQTWDGQGVGGLGIDDTFTIVTSAANQSAPFPTNTVAPTLTTDTGNFSAGSTITLNTGTWTDTNSYTYEILYGTSTPVATDSTATKTLVNTNQYVIKNSDATASSYYFRGRVTGYSGSVQTGNSAQAFTTTSARAILNPTTTISVGTATTTGFTISGTAGPLSGLGTTYVNITEIQIYNSSQSLVSTITTGLPTVNGTTGEWSYIWTQGSSSTTYYAKVKVTATDSDQTTFTTNFSNSIQTSEQLLPQNFTTISFTKALPVGSSQGVTRSTSLSWNASTNATKYRIQYEGKTNSGDAWTTVQTFLQDSDITSTSDSGTWSSPQQTGGFPFYNFMRASIRAANDSTTVKYSDSTADPSEIVWKEASGTAPSDPTFGTATKTDVSISQPFTASATSGSNFYVYTMEYKYKTSAGTYPTDWSTTSINSTTRTGTISISNLTASTTYNIKMRVKNSDDLYSGEVETSVTTNASTPVYSPVVWGSMTAPAFSRNNSLSRLRWGWNDQLPSSGDYTSSNIKWRVQYSTSNASTGQTASPTGLISTIVKNRRTGGGLTVDTTYDNRVSSLSSDYSTGNPTATGEPVTFSTAARYLRYRGEVVGSDGTTYVSNYSNWV